MSEMQVVSVSAGVAETVTVLTDMLAARGIEVFAVIDHGAGARQAALQLDDEVVVIFGNPEVGTRLMQADPRVGIDLPLRMLFWSEQGTTRVGYVDPHTLAENYALDDVAGVLDALAGLMSQLVDGLS